jgi:membrane protein involved in colicin uptake
MFIVLFAIVWQNRRIASQRSAAKGSKIGRERERERERERGREREGERERERGTESERAWICY